MHLTAQRVGHGALQGVNAFLYGHGRDISGEDPVALLEGDPGTLLLRMVEVEPGGNPVRSYLDVVFPDQATRPQIEAILDRIAHIDQPDRFPTVLRLGPAAAQVNMELRLVPVWRDELAELGEVARACVLSFPGLRVTPLYARRPGELDDAERATVLDAAARKDTETVLSLMRQLARARRLAEIAEVIRLYAEARRDPRLRGGLASFVSGIVAHHYVPTYGPDVFERFVEWGLQNPGWGDALNAAALRGGEALDAAARGMILR